ncbi:helix-turn-helix domain-containing protein [Yinghuangia sp. ASG 101]|uniref:helix-turn-helix domain-containing protein n=1 Tax=Yinghuangia sp. ASG 101 TaxID=2896848 RepID=UPI001E611454|nr:helix-turn-helix transcriptional regulator [Yinghuangia sp. ASG 101]UGQ08939.1 helix-turn-helix domain-containing protein [Yinghuangia sp. ASG 101]
MADEYQKALGRKIAFHRKRRGLSQKELAARLERSEAWVSQVERGVRKVDRMSVLEKIADVLDLPVAELAAEAPVVASVSEEPPGASRLRLLLSSAHSLNAMLREHPAPDVDRLRERTSHAWDLVHAGKYADLTDVLESLVPELEAGIRAVPDSERGELFRLLATAYQACSAALAKLGEPEAAWIAADRAIVAGERADDVLLMAASQFRLSLVFLGARQFAQAEQTARTASEALRPLVEAWLPAGASLWGALTLQRAMAAASSNNADAAYQHLDAAAKVARDVVGSGRNDYNTEFGPSNVALHRVAAAVELGDAGVALRAADGVDTSGLSAERQARFLIDVARAHVQRRQGDEAVARLEEAERLTPEQTRAHRHVRQMVADLLTIQDPPSLALLGLARRVGVLPVRTDT